VSNSLIDFNNFDNQKITHLVFNTLNTYNNYSYINPFPDGEKIYTFIEETCDSLLVDSLIVKINNEILNDKETIIPSSVAIIDSISCVGINDYSDIVRKCFYNWDNPSDMFFITAFGKNVGIINYYNKKTNTVYICCVFK
jgi:hypothetical protein